MMKTQICLYSIPILLEFTPTVVKGLHAHYHLVKGLHAHYHLVKGFHAHYHLVKGLHAHYHLVKGLHAHLVNMVGGQCR